MFGESVMTQNFDQQFLSAALGVTPSSSQNSYSRIWTDSRTCQSGDLFAAIPGEAFDGHDYILKAAEAGATGALVSRLDFPHREKLSSSFQLISVHDTIEALRALATLYRTTLPTEIIAVGGSNGKTTTKEIVSFLLGQLHGPQQIFKTKKSENSILGIALSMLQIRSERWAVLEIGIDEPGWMEKHLSLVRPHYGVITTIAEEHLERLKTIEQVAKEELRLLEFLRDAEGGFAANLDSPWIEKARLPTRHVSYALRSRAQLEGSYLAPQTLNCYGIDWLLRLPGEHNAQNLLAALAILKLTHPDLGLSALKTLSQSLKDFRGEPHRGEWYALSNRMEVYDDCYNANPDSMEKALETFQDLSKGKRSLVILGDMLDLGEASASAHRRILNRATVAGFDQVLLFGQRFEHALSTSPLKEAHVRSFGDLNQLPSLIGARPEAILIKGSRGMKLERSLPILESL